ncbi:MAG: class I SAM-dependent methyltransferase [Planctomycetaceae bacterium]|nr:class I SAM-dependent methyltransferase [Planctomycetaceae bacterium]
MIRVVHRFFTRTVPPYRRIWDKFGRLRERLNTIERLLYEVRDAQNAAQHAAWRSELLLAGDLETIAAMDSALVRRYVFAAAHIPKHAHVLDVACGFGFGAYYVATRTACDQVTGLDALESNLAIAQLKHESPKIAYVRGECAERSFSDEAFDVVLLLNASRNRGWDEPLFRRFAAMLSPDGTLIVAMVNRDRLAERDPSLDLVAYSAAQVQAMAIGAGLAVEAVFAQHVGADALVNGDDGDLLVMVLRKPKDRKS